MGKAQQTASGGRRDAYTVEQTDVPCWEQQASASETRQYEKRDIMADRKVFFVTDPGVTTRHQILITSRDRGVTTIASPAVLDVTATPLPDASAGLGALYRVMCGENTGERP
jgi:hypothetical protein